MNLETEAIERECVEENEGLRGQAAVLNRELKPIKGLLTDRFQISILPLTTILLSSMAKPVCGGAQREGIGNDETDILRMQLNF
jgi:hypothetical protein